MPAAVGANAAAAWGRGWPVQKLLPDQIGQDVAAPEGVISHRSTLLQNLLDLRRQALGCAIGRLQLPPVCGVGAIEPLQRDLRQLRLHAPLAAAGDGQRRFVRQHLLQRRPKLGFLSRLRLRIGRRGLTGLFEGGDTSDQIGFLGALAIEIRAQPMDLSSP